MAIRLYRSPVIPQEGFIHGFPERTGGVSTGLRSSLNLGARWGDDRDNVTTNRRLLAEHAGYDPAQLVATRHVHGTNVWAVGEPLPDDAEFDGLVCDRAGPVLGAFAADCVPILFADPVARVCGAAPSPGLLAMSSPAWSSAARAPSTCGSRSGRRSGRAASRSGPRWSPSSALRSASCRGSSSPARARTTSTCASPRARCSSAPA